MSFANEPFKIEQTRLEGRWVRLEPLAPAHRDEFIGQALKDPDLFRWYPIYMRTQEEIAKYFDQHLEMQASKEALPFATIDRESGRLVGATAMYAFSPENRRLEVGHTWITPAYQRTRVNTEAKLLQLQYCFETMGCIRVELKTDSLNERSRRAILRIGAKEEGFFRSHMITSTGRIRDTVYFSIIAAEWVEVKARLQAKLGSGR